MKNLKYKWNRQYITTHWTMCNYCTYKGIQNTCKETCSYWFRNNGFGQKTSGNNKFAK